MAKTPCYHVTTTNGDVFGVAATTKRDAMTMTQERLTREGWGTSPVRAERVGTWDADYGTVLAY
jgi:hypothetical protein